MPETTDAEKRAELVQLDEQGEPPGKKNGRRLEVQFNPETLTVQYDNYMSSTDRTDDSRAQYIRKDVSMTVDLFFDVTRPTGRDSSVKDVRMLTKRVFKFMEAADDRRGKKKEGQPAPPTVRFVWGSFFFDGVMNSMSENLEFFDPKGRPLRATVSISLVEQELRFALEDVDKPAGPGIGGSLDTGSQGPEERAPGAGDMSGIPIQKLAGEMGTQGSWKEIAARNNIENPRFIHNPDALTA